MANTINIKSDILNESYYLTTADCGLKIVCYPMPKSNGVHAVFATNFGSVDREFTLDGVKIEIPAGVAHFLEHKMFEKEEGDAFELFAKTGANANAFTSFDKTCYIFSATENVDSALDILLSFVTTPYFTKGTVEKEQGIIGQEIKMYDDNPSWQALFGVLDGLFVNHSVKCDIAGTVESIAQITPQLLYNCAKAFYSPSQMVLSVSGNITPEQVEKAVERAGFSTNYPNVERALQEEPKTINYSRKTINMPISIPLLTIGFKEDVPMPVSTKSEIIGDIIMDVLAGATSNLFNRLYDQNIVNGTFEGEIFSGKDYYTSIISGETQDPQLLEKEIRREIEILKKNGIDSKEFKISKNALYGNIITDFENGEEIAANMANQHLKGKNVFTALETLSTITLQDVNNQLQTMFMPDKCTVFTILPTEEQKDEI